jgi:hypothetical protein
VAILSIAELGRRAGVSRQGASKWVKDWGIPILTTERGARGVDENHPSVVNYIANASAQRQAAGRARASTEAPTASKPQGRAKVGQAAAAISGSPAPLGQGSGRDGLPGGLVVGGDRLPGRSHAKRKNDPDSDVAQGIKIEDRRWKRYRALNAKLLYEEKKLQTLRTEAVIHAFGQIKNALDPLRSYGEREGPGLLAFARDPDTSEAAMIARLNLDHDRIGRDIVAAVSRQLSELKKESKEAAEAEEAREAKQGADE